METIGIIGAGTMGRELASVFARNQYDVILYDCNENVLNQSENEIRNIIRFSSITKKIKDKDHIDVILRRISYSNQLKDAGDADLIVECVVENFDVKAEIFKELDIICDSSVIFSTNTSCISITKLASQTRREDNFIGIHFMNPVSLIDAVEVIKGYHMSNKTLITTKELLRTIGKDSIVIDDFPGFVSNRISHLMMNEAAFIVQDGYAQASDIDEVFKKCYGHKLGPLETADLIGLDTVVDSLDVLYNSYQDMKFRKCPLLVKMVDAGLKGRKSGQGFYKY